MPLPIQNPSFDQTEIQLVWGGGDSLTDSAALGKFDTELWLPVLVGKLNAGGANCFEQNSGHDGGNSSNINPGLLSRMFEAFLVGIPRLGFVWIGTNDTPDHVQSADNITSLTCSGTVATATVDSTAMLYAGCTISMSNAVQAGYNTASAVVLSVLNGTQFTYTVPGGTISPATAASPGQTNVTTLTSSSTTATVTVSGGHNLSAGAPISISGATPSAYNGTYTVATVISATQFTYTFAGGTSPATGSISLGAILCGFIPITQSQQNIQACVKVLKFGCGMGTNALTAVPFQTSLPANIPPGGRVVVMIDNSTTGGCVPAALQGSRIGGDFSGSPQQTVWQSSNNQPGELGWFRVAISTTPPDHVPITIVNGNHYLNWLSGGDTLVSQYAPWNDTTGVRAAQAAAGAGEAVASVGVATLTSTTAALAVISLTAVGSVGTLVTALPHNLFVGAQVTVTEATPDSYNGTFEVASIIDAETATLTLTSSPSSAASGATVTTYIGAITCSSWHGLYAGFQFTLSGASPGGYNGTFIVNEVDSTTTLLFTVGQPLASPATGTITLTWQPTYYHDIRPLDAALISGGIVTQGSFTWNFANGNVHRNQYGDELKAEYEYSLIVTIPGLMTLLASTACTIKGAV